MKKQALVRRIIEALEAELEVHARSARSARAEATDEQSKAENKYDTRGLEASYLARGQSRQVADIAAAIRQFDAFTVREFPAGSRAEVGALVTVSGPDGEATYFLGPAAGGTEVVHEKQEVMVLTSQSPLGLQVIGKCAGDKIELPGGPRKIMGRIVGIS